MVLNLMSFLMGNNLLINDLDRAAKRRKCSCVHSPALPRRVARRIALVRRDRFVHPARAECPPTEYGT